MIRLATPPRPPLPFTSLLSRLSPSHSSSSSLILLLLISRPSSSNNSSSRSRPFTLHSNNWPAPPGATLGATWWQPQLETCTKSRPFTRTSCRSPKGRQSNRSSTTVTSARSAAQVLRWDLKWIIMECLDFFCCVFFMLVILSSLTVVINCPRHTGSTLRVRNIKRRRQHWSQGDRRGLTTWAEAFRLSWDVNCVTSPALEWMLTLPISVGPSTRR